MSRPEKGSPEWDLWIAAIEIAAAAPLRQNPGSFSSQIPWSDVIELRRALDKLGIDWRGVKHEYAERRAAKT